LTKTAARNRALAAALLNGIKSSGAHADSRPVPSQRESMKAAAVPVNMHNSGAALIDMPCREY